MKGDGGPGLRAIVLIRDPEEAVLEFALVRPSLPPRSALRGYLRFYEPLLPHLGRFVVGPFPEVTTDLGGLILEVNDRYGTAFGPFEQTEESVRACFEQIDEDYRRRVSGLAFERQVARPSAVRERLKAELRGSYRAPALAGPRARAEAAYRALAGDPRTAPGVAPSEAG